MPAEGLSKIGIPGALALFNAALEDLAAAGAEIVDSLDVEDFETLR